ncbi:hypothetical protein [Clostridium sp.]|uniref:hypothetical protein n=1 Tax=Clostridium sp. TaxID=1506 RepID=UPI003D6CB1B6
MYLSDDEIKVLEQRFSEDDFNEYLQQLLDSDMIEGDTGIGIAKKVLDDGYDLLSAKQKKAFIFYVINPNYIKECSRCLTAIPWCEMVNSLDEGDEYCGYCSHMEAKDK